MTTGMRVWTLRISAVLVVASTALPGCSTPEDLFACNLPLSCPEMWAHIDFWDSPDEVACAGELVASGKPGVLLARMDPGPDIDWTQSLIILRGDGTAVLQNREFHCDGDAPACTEDTPWETPTEQQQCSVVIRSDIPVTCGGGTSEPCGWWPWGNLVNCTPIDPELSCNDVKAILAQ